jgi:hypothetical protein
VDTCKHIFVVLTFVPVRGFGRVYIGVVAMAICFLILLRIAVLSGLPSKEGQGTQMFLTDGVVLSLFLNLAVFDTWRLLIQCPR